MCSRQPTIWPGWTSSSMQNLLLIWQTSAPEVYRYSTSYSYGQMNRTSYQKARRISSSYWPEMSEEELKLKHTVLNIQTANLYILLNRICCFFDRARLYRAVVWWTRLELCTMVLGVRLSDFTVKVGATTAADLTTRRGRGAFIVVGEVANGDETVWRKCVRWH